MDGIKRRIILALISVRVENRADRSDSRNNSSSSGIKLEPRRTHHTIKMPLCDNFKSGALALCPLPLFLLLSLVLHSASLLTHFYF